ncbi:MAG: Ppx/GppA family phosphatase [Kiloniellales bacterium]|nr:Ppx/GppA family phosphatase [Kiloniellales bacterium]
MSSVRKPKGLAPRVRLPILSPGIRNQRRTRRRVAVIDIGSNSIRLVAFQGPQRVPVPIFNEKVLCGLARGLGETGRLNPEGVESALKNLERFTRLAAAMQADEVAMLATAAVREAEDGPAFVAEVLQRTGFETRVLTGEEEARYSAEGVIAGSPLADGIMGDLGGGSLELVRIDSGRVTELATLPLGPLRLLGETGRDGKVMRRRIEEALDSLPWLEPGIAPHFYAVGGSWRALARISMESRDYPLKVIHGYTMTTAELEDLTRVVARQTKESLARIKSVTSRRLETLPPAALILRRLLRRLCPQEVVFSAYGLREGWLYNRLSKAERAKDPLLEVAREVMERDNRFGNLGPELFAWSAPLFEGENEADARLREAACYFSDLAWREHPDYRASWALHRLLQWPFLAADHRERALLALTVAWRYGGSEAIPGFLVLLSPEDAERARVLGLALRLAYTLSAGTVEVLHNCHLYWAEGRLQLHLPEDGPVPTGNVVERRFAQLVEAVEGRS